MPCTVQISLDLHTIEDALEVAAIAVECGVDWLEAGTGLMVEQGLHVVTALRATYPTHPIVCDFKVCDGAAYFARIAKAAGATHFDVMAAAHDATLRDAGEQARQLGLTAIADTMFCADPVAAAVRAEALGVQMIGWTWGWITGTNIGTCGPLMAWRTCSKRSRFRCKSWVACRSRMPLAQRAWGHPRW